jgi:hypothetical protein
MTGAATVPDVEPGAGADEASVAEPSRPRRGGWVRLIGVLGIASLAVPFVAILVLSLTQPWWPGGDVALMEVRTFDVGGRFNPLLGVYSRFGWYHPGPLAYWVLAVPYRLTGARPVGMLVGTVLIHAAAVAGSVALAWRRGGRALAALVALLLALVIGGLGVDRLVYYWNPYLPLFAVAFLILATWSVLEGDIQLVPVVIAVSCFSWQAHFGYLGVTGVLAALSVVGGIVNIWRDRRAGGLVRYGSVSLIVLGAATAIVTAVCLAPVAFEQLTHQPGNVTLIAQSLADNRDKTIGLDRGLGIVGAHLSPLGIWLTGAKAADVSLGFAGALRLGLPLLALGIVSVLAWRARQLSALRFLAVTGVSAVAGLIAVARTVGAPYPYLADWMRPVAMLLWLSVAWGLVAVARSRGWLRDRRAARLAPGAAVVVALATVVASISSVAGGALHLPDEDLSAPVGVLGTGAVRAAAGQPLVHLRAGGGWCAGELVHGVAAALVESGTDIVVDPSLYPLEYGRERARSDPAPMVELVCGTDAGDRVARSATPPAVSVALLSPAELDRYRALKREMQQRLTALGRPDLADGLENPIVGASVLLANSDEAHDRDLARDFEAVRARGDRSGAIFYWPDGIPQTPN